MILNYNLIIIFSAHPTQLRSLAQVIIHEFAMLTGPIEKDEFERAKKQLQSMLLMNLESRPVVFEDIARQVLAQGKRENPETYIQKIRDVNVDDINRIATKMLASKPKACLSNPQFYVQLLYKPHLRT